MRLGCGAESRNVGAKIGDSIDAQSKKMPVAIERQLRASLVIASLIVGDEAFAARANPFHRPSQSSRCPGDDSLLWIMLALVTEAAAHVRRNQPYRGLWQVKLLADDTADVMRYLRGTIERQLSGRAAVG